MSDALKALLLLSLWCCLHPFAFVLPLAVAAGAGIGHAIGTVLEWLHHRWCVWRGRR